MVPGPTATPGSTGGRFVAVKVMGAPENLHWHQQPSAVAGSHLSSWSISFCPGEGIVQFESFQACKGIPEGQVGLAGHADSTGNTSKTSLLSRPV